jgi:hypothetical protein
MTITIGWVRQPSAYNVGRPTPLGNPFHLFIDGDRTEVIKLYGDWLDNVINTGGGLGMHKLVQVITQLSILYDAAKEGDIILGCHCSPQPCHAMHIKAWLEAFLETGERPSLDTIPVHDANQRWQKKEDEAAYVRDLEESGMSPEEAKTHALFGHADLFDPDDVPF